MFSTYFLSTLFGIIMGSCETLKNNSEDLSDPQIQHIERSVILILANAGGHQELLTTLLRDYGFANVVVY